MAHSPSTWADNVQHYTCSPGRDEVLYNSIALHVRAARQYDVGSMFGRRVSESTAVRYDAVRTICIKRHVGMVNRTWLQTCQLLLPVLGWVGGVVKTVRIIRTTVDLRNSLVHCANRWGGRQCSGRKHPPFLRPLSLCEGCNGKASLLCGTKAKRVPFGLPYS